MSEFSKHWLDKFLNKQGLDRSNKEVWILLAFAQYLDNVNTSLPRNKTKTITLCRWRQTETHDGKPGQWCSWRDPCEINDRDSCGGFIEFEEQFCEVEVPE